MQTLDSLGRLRDAVLGEELDGARNKVVQRLLDAEPTPFDGIAQQRRPASEPRRRAAQVFARSILHGVSRARGRRAYGGT